MMFSVSLLPGVTRPSCLATLTFHRTGHRLLTLGLRATGVWLTKRPRETFLCGRPAGTSVASQQDAASTSRCPRWGSPRWTASRPKVPPIMIWFRTPFLWRVLKDAAELDIADRSSPQGIADAALRQAAQLEVSASQGRIKQWHDAVQNNVHRLRRWVCRTAAPAPGPLDDAPVHPVDIVAAEHVKWGAQWSIPAPHTQAETRDWCARLGPATAPWADDLLHPSPAAVLACLRASLGGLLAWTLGRRLHSRCCRCLSFSF